MDRRMNIKTKVITAFLVIFLALIFFSQTIYTYNLSVVTAGMPSRGNLYKTDTTTGIVGYSSIYEIYSDISGKAIEVLVSKGDVVQEGQPIAYMTYDTKNIMQALEQINFNRSKIFLDIENINMQINQTTRYMEQLNAEIYTAETYDMEEFSDYDIEDFPDHDIKTLERNITKAEADYIELELLYEVGGASKKQLDDLLENIDTLKENYNMLKNTRNENIKKAERQLAERIQKAEKQLIERTQKAEDQVREQERVREIKLQDYHDNIRAYELQLKAKDLELKNLDFQESTYISDLEHYDRNETIYAPSTGILISLEVRVGQSIHENQLIASIGTNERYSIECEISLENTFVAIGDVCRISNPTHSLEAVVTNIEFSDNSKKITLTIDNDNVSIGETFQVRFQKRSLEQYTLVPNSAIHKDQAGYFVYQIKQRDGVLGKEYYASMLRVYIGDSDNENTAILEGMSFFEPITLLSNKPFSHNETIKVKNESDFFEN